MGKRRTPRYAAIMADGKLGSWVIDREIGRGGMGTVYLARHDAADGDPRQAAVKVLAPELAADPGFLERFRREIDTLRQLHHPNIVQLYEAGTQDGRHYYAMEYVPGKDCEQLRTELGRLPWKDVLSIALQVAPALKHAHDRGVIHRDIKPHNLIRTDDGTVKLTDFGIARVFAGKSLTVTGGLVGTAEYVSPEQAAGKPVTNRSDLYSLGVVLYTLLTGQPPFEGSDVVDLLHKHRYAQFDRPKRLVPDLPYDFDDIVCRLLAKNPADRPANGQVLYRDLERVRRKIEVFDMRTVAAGTEAADVESEPEPAGKAEDKPGPATLMSKLMRAELTRQQRGGPVARLFNQPWVLIPLFLASMTLLVWLVWPRQRAAPEELFQEGSRLMASDDPADWDRAWKEYLGPLERKYRDNPYAAELERMRRLKDDREAQVRALDHVKDLAGASVARRFYERGLALCRDGEPEQARRTWQAVVATFQGVPAEERWVQLAQEGLGRLEARLPSREGLAGELRREIERVQRLRDAGKNAEADTVLRGLKELYRDDPAAEEMLKQAADRAP
jgi:serine/threonine-protein kinase